MIKSLEGLRGIAALIVALYHLKIGSEYFPIIRNGYLFVDLFFVLSGFVICAAYSGRMQTVDDFMAFVVRRIGRLFPLLVFSTIAFILASDAIVLAKNAALALGYGSVLNNPGTLEYLVPSVAEIAATLTFTHSLGLFDDLILNTPTWSISTEFYTYFLFAGVCLLARGRPRLAIFVVLSIAGLLISAWASVNVHNCIEEKGCLSLTYDFGFVRCVHAFFLGALACYASRWQRISPAALQLTVLFALFLLLTLVDHVPAAAFAFPLAFAVLVLSLCNDTGPLADALKAQLFQVLGTRSYSIYLMHMPLLLIFENLTKRADGILSSTTILIGYIVTLFVISGWTYRYIEQPLRERFNRMTSRSGAATRRTSA